MTRRRCVVVVALVGLTSVSLAAVSLASVSRAAAQDLGRELGSPRVQVFTPPPPPPPRERLPGVARTFSFIGAAVLASGVAVGASTLAYSIADEGRCHRRPGGAQLCDPWFVGGVAGAATLVLALPGALALTAELLGEPVEVGWLYLGVALGVPSGAFAIVGVVDDDETLRMMAPVAVLPAGVAAGTVLSLLSTRRGRGSAAPRGRARPEVQVGLGPGSVSVRGVF